MDDLYPVRRNWTLAMFGLLVLSPVIWAGYEGLWNDPVGDAIIRGARWILWIGGAAVVAGGTVLAVRSAWRAFSAWERREPLPHGWAALLSLGMLIALHGYALFVLPEARIIRWRVVPEWVLSAGESLLRSFGY